MNARIAMDWSTAPTSALPHALVCGADHAGMALKEALVARLTAIGIDTRDTCSPDQEGLDYPLSAIRVGGQVQADSRLAGLLVCNTGIGMSMAANRIPGIRAALVSWKHSARAARRHNAANVLCLGGADLDVDRAWDIVTTFMSTPFAGGHHAARVAILTEMEREL